VRRERERERKKEKGPANE